ncbi:MAG: zinc ribbon domain-containing protein [Thermodesulfobacteriota bacterium]
MPIYEYHCSICKKVVSIFFLSYSDARNEATLCPECGSAKLERILSSVSVIKERQMGPQVAGTTQNIVKDDKPKELANAMSEAVRESSADYGDDFKEVKSRLEKGESATSVEKSMRKRVGESMQTH